MFSNLKVRIVGSYIISTISITLVLLLFAILSLTILNARKFTTLARETIRITIIIRPGTPEGDIIRLQKELDRKNFTKETEYISQDQALEIMKKDLGSDIADLLEYNPLPPIINMTLNAKFTSQPELDKILKQIRAVPIVDDIFYNKAIVYRLNKNLKAIGIITSALSIILFLIAVSLIGSTVRLVIYSKRHEIHIMQLVGASPWFVQKPFLRNALFQGLISSLLAIIFTLLIVLFIQNQTQNIIKISYFEVTSALVFLTGMFITVATTYFSVNKYLWAEERDLWT